MRLIDTLAGVKMDLESKKGASISSVIGGAITQASPFGTAGDKATQNALKNLGSIDSKDNQKGSFKAILHALDASTNEIDKVRASQLNKGFKGTIASDDGIKNDLEHPTLETNVNVESDVNSDEKSGFIATPQVPLTRDNNIAGNEVGKSIQEPIEGLMKAPLEGNSQEILKEMMKAALPSEGKVAPKMEVVAPNGVATNSAGIIAEKAIVGQETTAINSTAAISTPDGVPDTKQMVNTFIQASNRKACIV
ncbi:MAG: hypothetical protein EBR32_01860 [Bacteroidetes bacterium]|nr:hypothetical protein [Bacteroidota bacterium]